jgi:hypothetical protein
MRLERQFAWVEVCQVEDLATVLCGKAQRAGFLWSSHVSTIEKKDFAAIAASASLSVSWLFFLLFPMRYRSLIAA